MSFSQTELVNAMRLLSTRLPQFPEQQNQVSRMLRIVTERLSSHLNENLKAFGINENLWFSLMAVYVSPNRGLETNSLIWHLLSHNLPQTVV